MKDGVSSQTNDRINDLVGAFVEKLEQLAEDQGSVSDGFVTISR
jgi:hypothetical protein